MSFITGEKAGTAMTTSNTNSWRCALELSPDRTVRAGSFTDLAAAVGRGADLRLYTEFLHEEHISPGSSTPGINDARNHGLIRESIDFRQTILIDGSHVAGATLLRQPLEPTTGFNGVQPKMSFFMYNMTGEQSHANIVLDDTAPTAAAGERKVVGTDASMLKMSEQETFDAGTLAPSRNFIYAFEKYRFFVSDTWTEVLSHDEAGRVVAGSIDAVEQAQIDCREFKVAIRGLGHLLGKGPDHETFISVGSGFFHTGRRFHETLSHPLLRIAPAVPMQFGSHKWDVCWVALRTDGVATVRRLDPYTRRHADAPARVACRWFAR
jgi:hypothetical protein